MIVPDDFKPSSNLFDLVDEDFDVDKETNDLFNPDLKSDLYHLESPMLLLDDITGNPNLKSEGNGQTVKLSQAEEDFIIDHLDQGLKLAQNFAGLLYPR